MTFGRRDEPLGVQTWHKGKEDRVCHSEPQPSRGGLP